MSGAILGVMSDRPTRKSIVALFEHPSAGQDAATALLDAGFDREGVSRQPGASDEVLRTERNQDPDVIQRGFIPAEKGLGMGFALGFLGGGFFGLLLGSGSLNFPGMEPAMAAGPFWSAVIGAVAAGFAGAFAGYMINTPLPAPEPAHGGHHRQSYPTIVSVTTTSDDTTKAREVIERSAPASVTVWQADDGDWTPLASN